MSPTAFDPERPVESFKQLLRELLEGYEFDVKGLKRCQSRHSAINPHPCQEKQS